jgi:hypothetical protein
VRDVYVERGSLENREDTLGRSETVEEERGQVDGREQSAETTATRQQLMRLSQVLPSTVP